ncbi:MAG: hypothetical protein AAB340_01565 [Patescibacteria group bacterium]
MYKLLDVIYRYYKQKKLFFFILLFFIVTVGVLMPNKALAVGPLVIPVIQGLIWIVGSILAVSIVTEVVWPIAVNEFGTAIVVGLSRLISWSTFKFAEMTESLFNFILSTFVNYSDRWSITRNDAFLSSWVIMRDWANMLIIVGLIAIAVATILNFEKYRAQKLLAPIIIVALLVNFSVVFVGLFIDASNIVMASLLANGNELSTGLIRQINNNWNLAVRPLLQEATTFNASVRYAGVETIFSLFYLLVGLTLIYFSLTLIQRYILLALLFIFSPLAFVAFVFPDTKGLFKQWWDKFIQWCFVGVGSSFMLFISFKVMNSNVHGDNLSFSLFIVMGFLFIGLKITKKAAGPLASAVIGIAKTAGIAIASGGTALAGKLAMRAGGERAWNATKEKVSERLERLGLRAAGSTAAMRARRAAALTPKEKEQLNNMTPEQLMHAATARAGLGESGMRMKSAAIAKSFEKGLMNNLTPQEQEEHARYAIATDRNYARSIIPKMSSSSQADIITNNEFDAEIRNEALKGLASRGELNRLTQPQLLDAMQESQGETGSDLRDVIGAMEGIDMAHIIQNGLFNPQTRAKVFKTMADKKQLDLLSMAEQITAMTEAAANGVKPGDVVGKMSSETQSHIINNNLFNPETRGKATEALMRKDSLHMVDPARRGVVATEFVQNGGDIEDLERKDYHYGEFNPTRAQQLANAGVAPADIPQAARSQTLDENFNKMSDDQKRRIDTGDLTYERVRNWTPEIIDKYQFADGPQRTTLRGLRTRLGQDYNIAFRNYRAASSRTPPDRARANTEYEKSQKIKKLIGAITRLRP